MLQVHDKQAFHDDGTPRCRYEIDEHSDRRIGFRVVIGLAVLSVLAFVKNILPSPVQVSDAANDQSVDDTRHGIEGDTPSDSDRPAEDGQDAPNQPTSEPLKPAVFRASLSIDVGPEMAGALTSLRANDNWRVSDPVSQFAFTMNEPVLRFGDSQLGRDSSGSGASDPGASDPGASGPGLSDPGTSGPDDPRQTNRRPVTLGMLSLGAIFLNAHLLIAVADLLEKAFDADNDKLTVHDLSVSSGTLTSNANGSWHYLPLYDDARPVVFRYRVSDGEADVWQTAVLNIDPHSINQIDGTADNDDILGSVRNDLIKADSGNDLIVARGGDDVIHGGGGNDRIDAGAGNDVVYADAGDDFVLAGEGDDTVYGELGNDALFGEAGNDVLSGGQGNDLLYGGDGADLIDGGDGDDTADGGAGNDLIFTGNGNDTIFLSAGLDLIDGGANTDTLDASGIATAITANLSSGTLNGADGTTAVLISIENITTGDGNDLVTGSAAHNVIATGGGNDTVVASQGYDTINGGEGRDRFDVGASTADVVADLDAGIVEQAGGGRATLASIENITTGTGNDHVTGSSAANDISTGAGDDVITASAGGDRIDGGTGRDTYDASADPDAAAGCPSADVTVDLLAGTARGNGIGRDVISSIEIVITGRGNDAVTGNDAANVISTGKGNDIVDAGGGNDTIRAGDGDDIIVLRLDGAHDDIDGGNGRDTLDLSTVASDLLIDLAQGIVAAAGDADVIDGIENVTSGSGNDRIIANFDVNTLFGGAGNDSFIFLSSDDTGCGRGRRDRIMDFDVGDQIDIDRLTDEFDGSPGRSIDSRFTLLADGMKFAEPGQLRFKYDDFEGGPRFVLEGNLNRDEFAEFEIEISGNTDLIASYLFDAFGRGNEQLHAN